MVVPTVGSTTTNPVLIGSSPGLLGRALTGKMDDVRIYNRALSPAEVETLVTQINMTLEVTAIRRLANGNVELDWTGAPGEYFLEYSFDLTAGSWLELSDSEVIASGETTGVSTDATIAPTADKLFYRFRPID